MTRRQSNNPKRRFVEPGTIDQKELSELADALIYVGSANHKAKAADYGFHPPANPRPTKSVCDKLRVIQKREAAQLLHTGVLKGMVSTLDEKGIPKYVWAVDEDGEAYEAKGDGGSEFHGYRLPPEDDMRDRVLKEWKRR